MPFAGGKIVPRLPANAKIVDDFGGRTARFTPRLLSTKGGSIGRSVYGKRLCALSDSNVSVGEGPRSVGL